MLEAGIACIALNLGCSEIPDEEETDDGADTGASDGASGSADSTGQPACDDPETVAVFADEAVLATPMALGEAVMLGRDVARSHIAEMGTMTVEFTTTCAGPVYLWALVWDHSGGVEPDNPDSLYVSVDGGPERPWLYGCGTAEETDMRWWWLAIDAWEGDACEHDPLDLDLPAGTHTVVIRNRESGVDIDVAAIAAVVASHDPAANPSTFLLPPE